MVEPLSPASFATCNKKSCQLKILHTLSTNATATTHLTQGCWPTPSIILSRYAQRQHGASVLLILGQLPQFLVHTGRLSALCVAQQEVYCHRGGLIGLKGQLEPMHRWECCGLGTSLLTAERPADAVDLSYHSVIGFCIVLSGQQAASP